MVSIVFLVAMAYFYTATSSSHIAKNYEATLTPEQRSHYKDIVSERTRLAYEGYGLGFIISVVYIWINRVVIKSGVGRLFKREKMSVVCGASNFKSDQLFLLRVVPQEEVHA